MSGDGGTGTTWKTWAEIGGIVLGALIFLALLPLYLRGGATDLDAIWVNGLALLAGGWGFRTGWREFRRRQLIRGTPTSKVRSMAVGAVEVKGEARPVDEPLVSPMSHQKACMFELEVEEYHPDDDGGDWRTVLQLEESVPFHLDDGTGEVLVEPEAASLSIEVEEKIQLDDGDEPPAALGEWAQDRGLVDEADAPEPEGITDKISDLVASQFADDAEKHLVRDSRHDRRYTEKVLAVGEETYVFGGAEPREGVGSQENARNLVVRRHPGTDTFLVSDRSERELANEKLVGTVFLLCLGVVGIPYGVLGSLRWFGFL